MLLSSDRDTIEAIMDANSLESILETIGDICILKADHVESRWQDRELAGAWRKLAIKINGVASHAMREEL